MIKLFLKAANSLIGGGVFRLFNPYVSSLTPAEKVKYAQANKRRVQQYAQKYNNLNP